MPSDSRRIGALVAAAACCAAGPSRAEATAPPGWVLHAAPNPKPSAAYRWVDVILEATARDVDKVGARPTIISRQMALAVTVMFDAWAAYDDKAVGTQLGGKLRRPPAERTDSNRAKAIGTAVYRALLDQFPEDTVWLQSQARQEGLNPDDAGVDPATPQGLGNLAAAAVLAARRHDGSNRYGDEPGSNGKPYSDYTGYRVTQAPEGIDPDHWRPIPFTTDDGATVLIGFLTPQWYRVRPFALERADQFRPPPPPAGASEKMKRDTEEAVAANANLTLEQRALVEFMRDGPRSTGQSGHWLRFAQDVSRRDGNDLARDVKLFFTVGNVAFDAFIAAWDAKRYYDTSRPYWYVRYLYKGRQLDGWGGPGLGTVHLPAEHWRPYSPASFVTPPFPGYVSGHSAVSGASAKILELFTGSDRFGTIERRSAGALTEPKGTAPGAMLARHGAPPKAPPASAEVELRFHTFSATAEAAGQSRILGGYHVQIDNTAGLTLGRKVASATWRVYQSHFDGTAAH